MIRLFKERHRANLRSQEFAPHAREFLVRNVTAYQMLPRQLRKHVEDFIKVFVAEQQWEASHNFEVTEEMQITVAAHAAIMMIGVRDYYFDKLTAIVLFPDVIERFRNGTLYRNMGEAWSNGAITLSWPGVLEAGQRLDGNNLVVHELAHHLDRLDGLHGEMAGSIPFPDAAQADAWERVSLREFESLQVAADRNEKTLLRHYGAKNRAEFFAVACECFFELPHQLRTTHPQLFDLLREFFQTNPIDWLGASGDLTAN